MRFIFLDQLNYDKLKVKYKDDLKKLITTGKSYFIGGDSNSKHRFWNYAKARAAGKIFFNEMCSKNFSVHFSIFATYSPRINRSILSTIDTGH